jgi:hypothetical protein
MRRRPGVYCGTCGAPISDPPPAFCPRCGAPKAAAPPPTSPNAASPVGRPQYLSDTPVPNYLVPAILVTIFCCMPLGIVAIYQSSQVNTRLATGDVAGAREASETAKRWCWIAGLASLVPFAFFACAFGGSFVSMFMSFILAIVSGGTG